jgi:hypothetical protein
LAELEAIAGTEIDLQFAQTLSNRCNTTRIAALQTSKATQHLGDPGAVAEVVDPLRKRFGLDHRRHAEMYLMGYKCQYRFDGRKWARTRRSR